MKITKKQLIKFWNTIEGIAFVDFNRKFSYCIVRNKMKIKDEINALAEAQKPSEEFVNYENNRLGLCEQFCERQEDGKPMYSNKNYVFSAENKSILDSKMDVLTKENEDVINTHNEQMKQIVSILEEEIDVDFYQISIDDFPDTITPDALETLSCLVKEEE